MEVTDYRELLALAVEHQARLSSSPFFLTGEDQLRVTSFNAAAGVTLAIEGRRLDEAGRVVAFLERHVPNTDRSSASTSFALGAGFLLNVQIRASAGTPRGAQCFALLEVVRGQTGAVVPLATLVQGYVPNGQRLAWPGSRIRSSLEGPGAIRSIAGTDPAAGAEISEAVPTGARWRLIALSAQLVTNATVATRVIVMVVDDGATGYFSALGPNSVTASKIATVIFAPIGYPVGANDSFVPILAPPDLILAAGHRIRTATTSLQAGDNYGAPQLLVEEWLEP